MSYGNKNVDSKKTYSLYDLPPVKSCGGKLDKDGMDTYWGSSLTLQAEAENADIPLIMEKYAKTGVINANIKSNLQFGDASMVPSYHEAYNLIAQSHELFDSLDAKIRSRFQNDPSNMINFIADKENYDEAVKLGIALPKKIIENVKTEPVSVEKEK